MSTINDGGPAFPLQSIGPDFAPGYAGMTLRDYFAAKAMQGDWAAQGVACGMFVPDSDDELFARSARMYYRMADAMLAASKPDPQQ